MTIINCDNCNIEFNRTPNQIVENIFNYCCNDCKFYHRKFKEYHSKNDRSQFNMLFKLGKKKYSDMRIQTNNNYTGLHTRKTLRKL